MYVLGVSQKLDLIKQIHGHAYNTWWTNVVSYDALCLCDCHTGQALDGAGWWIGELPEDRFFSESAPSCPADSSNTP